MERVLSLASFLVAVKTLQGIEEVIGFNPWFFKGVSK